MNCLLTAKDAKSAKEERQERIVLNHDGTTITTRNAEDGWSKITLS